MTSSERAFLRRYGPASIVASAIAVDYGPRFDVSDDIYRCIKHCIYEVGIRSDPYGPTCDETDEAINDRGKIDFTCSDVELGDIG